MNVCGRITHAVVPDADSPTGERYVLADEMVCLLCGADAARAGDRALAQAWWGRADEARRTTTPPWIGDGI